MLGNSLMEEESCGNEDLLQNDAENLIERTFDQRRYFLKKLEVKHNSESDIFATHTKERGPREYNTNRIY